MFCPKCGNEISDNARFCTNCGAQITLSSGIKSEGPESEDDPGQVEQKNEKERKSENGKDAFDSGKNHSNIILVVIICVIAAAAVIFLSLGLRERSVRGNVADSESLSESLESGEKSVEEEVEADDETEAVNKNDSEAVDEDDMDSVSDNETESEVDTATEEDESVSAAYTWAVEPTIIADDINYVSMSDYSENYPENAAYRQKYSRCAVIERDGSYSLIDLDGEILGNITYVSPVDIANSGYYNEQGEPDVVFYVGVNGDSISEYDGEIFSYCWYDETINDFIFSSLEDAGPSQGYMCSYDNGLYLSGATVLDFEIPDYPFPLKTAVSIPENAYDYVDTTGKYAVFYGDGLITDFIYDACGSYCSGLLAVCQNGKWGYINDAGEEIIPIEYDSSWVREDDYTRNHIGETTMPFAYSATDGYVALVKDGEWELRDTDGNLIISPGEFEEIRPVYEGKCWVKYDGKWGVIQLEE